jgi:hypothetical protein
LGFWDDLIASQQSYQQQPAPGNSYAPQGNGFWDQLIQSQQDYQQQPPAYQYQTPQPVPDPFSIVNQFTNNAFESASNSNYFDNLANAVTSPWSTPAKSGMNPFEWTGDVANRAASSTFGGVGAVFQPIGEAVDAAANSNIPIVDPFAEATQTVWTNVVEPAANLPTSIYGALSRNGDPFDLLHGAGPAGYVIGGAADILQGRDPTQYYKDVAGKLPQTELAKMAFQPGYYEDVTKEQSTQNPFTIAEQPGLEAYQKLPAAVQLPLAFSETLNPGNLAYNAAITPLIRGAGKVAGAAADVTGLSGALIPWQRSSKARSSTTPLSPARITSPSRFLGDAEAQLGSPTRPASAVFEQPDSPFYWEKQGIHPEVAQGAQYFLQAERQANAPVDNAMQPGETKIPQTESDFARQLAGYQPTPAPKPPNLRLKPPSACPKLHNWTRPYQSPTSLTSSSPKAPGRPSRPERRWR